MAWEIPIYQNEKRDGIADQVRSQGSIAYIVPIRFDLKKIVEQHTNLPVVNRVIAAKRDFDLFFMNSIQATVGINKNDDLFDPFELWAARHTAEDKPLNVGHNFKDIIGHITDSYAVNSKFEIIPDDTVFEEVPDKFHIMNGEVIYLKWHNNSKPDEEAESRIAQLVGEIKQGEWAVSMECLFNGFDYGVIDPEGNKNVVVRDKESSFLTKYLRAYGGPGVYRDKSGKSYELKRLMRNITFSGKGIVKHPANPESIIFQTVNDFKSLGYVSLGNLRENVMPENTTLDISALTNKVTELTTSLANLQSERDALNKRLAEIDTQRTSAQIETLKTDVSRRDTEISELKNQLTSAQATIAEKDKQIDNVKSENTTLKKQVSDMTVAQRTQSRENLLVSKGVPLEEAKKLVTKFNKYEDEDFNEVADLASAKYAKPASANATTIATETQRVDQAVPQPSNGSPPPEDVNAKIERSRAALGAFMGGFFGNGDDEENG